MARSNVTRYIAVALAIPAMLAPFPHAAAQRGRGHQDPTRASSDSARMADMADHVMSGAMDDNMMKHMALTPIRPATRADSVRATNVAAELTRAIARYRDTAAAVADGYRMFMPAVKNQRVFHFTSNRRALLSMFHFDPAKPTSVLYKRGSDGALHLVGAMYTLGEHASLSRLNDRVPLSIARWHEHINWCLPRKGDAARWSERKDGAPVFGPESPIATKDACRAVGGDFHRHVFGWMLHANVIEGHDLATIFGSDPH
ncbi:MAG TPA: hypothetical protein VII52_02435 [Gemmatimonadaceae bacterium]